MQVNCSSARDYTCKIDATGLIPGAKYAFKFLADGGVESPVGRFKLPMPKGSPGQNDVKFAFFSCR